MELSITSVILSTLQSVTTGKAGGLNRL